MPLTSALVLVGSIATAQANPWSPPPNRVPTRWVVVGPFPSTANAGGAREGFDRDFLGGEASAQLREGATIAYGGATYTAKPVQADGAAFVDLAATFNPNTDMKCAYAYTEWTAPKAERLQVYFGSDDGAKVWLNGKAIHSVKIDRAHDPESDRFAIDVAKGKNRLLVKVDNGAGGWGFSLRAFDEKGAQALESLRVRRNLEELDPGPEQGSFILGSSFPKIVWRKERAAHEVFGDAPIRTIWFGPDGKEAVRPDRPGRYAALIQAQARDGFVHRQFLTFAKAPDDFDPYVPTPPFSEPVPTKVPADVLGAMNLDEADREELSRHLWAGFGEYIRRSESAAVLLAALVEKPAEPNRGPSWLNSGFVRNAEFQLGIRMQLEGRRPKTIAPPAVLAEPAAELRVGSEAEAGVKPGTADRLREVCRQWVQDDPNGFVALVAHKGVVFFHEGFGGFTPDSFFYPASIGKAIAGMTFARAVDQGLVSFDDPIGQTLPSWKGGPFDKVTYRHCFYHLTDLGGHASHGGLYNAYLDEALFGQDAKFGEPGRRHRYNGDGYNLAGKALELTTGRSFWRHLYEGMQAPFGEPVTQFDNGFGDRFNAKYLAKVGLMMLQDGKYGRYQVFRPGFVKTLFPSRVADRVPGFPDKNLEWGIGLTWMPDAVAPGAAPALGPHVVGHGAASASVWRVSPEHDLVVVIGRNRFKDGNATSGWAAKFMAALAEGLPKK